MASVSTYRRRQAAGLCPECGGARSDTHVRCEKCRLYYRRINKARHRRGKYGLTAEQYTALVVAQEGRCAICGEAGNLCVDHSHATGAVRGLLCHNCNIAIGFMHDDATRLRDAAAYLDNSE